MLATVSRGSHTVGGVLRDVLGALALTSARPAQPPVRRFVRSRLWSTTKALADPAICQGLLSWRGQDLNLRPSGYECTDAHGTSWALIGVLPVERANRDRREALSSAPVGARWCSSCCTTVVRDSCRVAPPRSSALVGASRADTLLTAASPCRPHRDRRGSDVEVIQDPEALCSRYRPLVWACSGGGGTQPRSSQRHGVRGGAVVPAGSRRRPPQRL